MLKPLSEPAKELQRFRAGPWKHQRTFKTPLKDLKRFVSALLLPYSLDSGALMTDEVVFEPKSVLKLVADAGIELENSYKFSLEVKGRTEIAELLETVLSDWIDFLFLPSPQLFAIYADHDEYITFYTPDDES